MKSKTFSRLTLVTPVVGAALMGLTLGTAKAVGTRHFVLDSKADFEAGEMGATGVDSRGRLHAGLGRVVQSVSEAPSVWAALETKDGVLLATGNDGKLLRVSGGVTQVIADTDELALTSLVQAFGKVLVSGMPSGTVYELKDGKLSPFARLEGAPNIYALAYDEKSKALYVGTGPDGKLYRVNENGRSEEYFDSSEGHLTSLLVSGGGVFVGTSGKARLYEVTGPGRARVVYDFDGTEIRSLTKAPDGTLFVIVNELSSGARGEGPSGTRPATSGTSAPQKGKGALYRLNASGQPEELFTKSEEHFTWLGLYKDGNPVVGTGSEGRIHWVSQGHETRLLMDTESRQIAYARLNEDSGLVVGSDAAMLVTTSSKPNAESEWTSKPLDAGLVARYGLASVESEGNVTILTRSGNTDEPDAAWSDWTKLDRNQVKSPAGRYLQLRVELGERGVLTSLDIPFLTDNLRAVVTSLDAESGVKKKDTRGLSKSGGPRSEKASPNVKVSWKVKNPDNDELRYYVDYQLVGSPHWFDLLNPGQVLTDEKVTWNTENLPEGRYRIRVTASDELSNPAPLATKHTLESAPVFVDNTPPSLSGLKVEGRKISLVVSDRVGPVERVEVRLEGAEPWLPLAPKDGIFDENVEEIVGDLSSLAPSGPALLVVRAYDLAGNSDVLHVTLSP